MRTVTISILILLVFVAGAFAETEPLNVDVMSFNIRYGTAADGENHWDGRKDLVCDVIRDHAPDLVGLQEALDFQIEQILDALPGYATVGEGRDGGTAGEYSAILYRAGRFHADDHGTFWLSDTPDTPSQHWGNACVRICTWGRFVERESGRALYMYNTHLDHVSQPSREKSVRLIVERIGGRGHADPFVLTGDFNAGESNPAIRYLVGDATRVSAAMAPAEGKDEDVRTAQLREARDEITTPIRLRDSFRVLHPDSADVGTFNGFEGKVDGNKIDYVFVASDVEVLHAAIVRVHDDGRYPSDHFPVTASLQFGADPESR